jgi:hypothetical protein
VSEQTPGGARAITADLMARLRRHYIKPGPMPGGVFIPEVGINGGFGQGRRCDAIYAGFTSSSGRLLVGHEVKASRADWLTELGKLDKADTWADACHAWYLVTVPGVVRPGELPAGWGLMTPGRARTRLEVQTPAKVHADRTPPWDAVRSIMARLDTLQAAERVETERRIRRELHAQLTAAEETRRTALAAQLNADDGAAALAQLRELEGALGVRVLPDTGREWGTNLKASTIAELATLLADAGTLQAARRQLTAGYTADHVQSMRQALAEYERAVAALREGLSPRTADGPEPY